VWCGTADLPEILAGEVLVIGAPAVRPDGFLDPRWLVEPCWLPRPIWLPLILDRPHVIPRHFDEGRGKVTFREVGGESGRRVCSEVWSPGASSGGLICWRGGALSML
jgi:hypothetical protein